MKQTKMGYALIVLLALSVYQVRSADETSLEGIDQIAQETTRHRDNRHVKPSVILPASSKSLPPDTDTNFYGDRKRKYKKETRPNDQKTRPVDYPTEDAQSSEGWMPMFGSQASPTHAVVPYVMVPLAYYPHPPQHPSPAPQPYRPVRQSVNRPSPKTKTFKRTKRKPTKTTSKRQSPKIRLVSNFSGGDGRHTSHGSAGAAPADAETAGSRHVLTKVKHHHHHHHHKYLQKVVKKVPVKVEVPIKVIVPKTIIKEKKVPYPVEKIVHKVIEKKVPYPVVKKVPYPVKVKVPYPVKVVEKEYIPKPYPVIKHVEVVKHVQVKVPVPHPVPYPVEKKVPYPVEVKVPVRVEVEKKVPYPVEVEKKIHVPVKVFVPQPYPVEKKVPYPVEVKVKEPYPVYKHVPVPYKVYVDKPVAVPVPKPYPVTVEKRVPYPVEVEKKVPIPVKIYLPHEGPEVPGYGYNTETTYHGFNNNLRRSPLLRFWK